MNDISRLQAASYVLALAGEEAAARSLQRILRVLQQLNPNDVEILVNETDDLGNIDPLITLAELAQQESEIEWDIQQSITEAM